MGGGSSKSSGRRSETEALHADVPFVLLKDDQACFRITSKGAVVTTAGAITAPAQSQKDCGALVQYDPQANTFWVEKKGSVIYTQICGDEQAAVDRGCAFRLGECILECKSNTGDTIELELLPDASANAASDQPVLFTVEKDGASIGRKKESQLRLAQTEVSGHHASINYELGQFYIRDAGSTNGTFRSVSDKHELQLDHQVIIGSKEYRVLRFDYGVTCEQGARNYLEDRYRIVQDLCVPNQPTATSFLAVYDGHGGDQMSQQLQECLHLRVADVLGSPTNAPLWQLSTKKDAESQAQFDEGISAALLEAFLATDKSIAEEFLPRGKAYECIGSTCISVLVTGSKVFCANVGDSRAVICHEGCAVDLSHDHKPTDEHEQKRIHDAGGVVFKGRVLGQLAVSRAFGDYGFKEVTSHNMQKNQIGAPLVIVNPDIKVVSLTEKDEFMVLACDGLYDVLSSQEVVDFVRAHRCYPDTLQVIS